MSSSTPPNLVENANSLPLAISGEHWTFSVNEDKYKCMVDGCKAKGYGHKNHFRKHMLSHSLHVAWDKGGRPKQRIGKSRKGYQKYNALVLSDEMGRKQKELNSHERKWLKQATKDWESISSLEVPHKNLDKPVLGFILDPVLDRFLGIHEWGHHIAPLRFNKLITGSDFAEYLMSSKGVPGVRPLKQAWKKATWRDRDEDREGFVDELLRWNKKIEHTRL